MVILFSAIRLLPSVSPWLRLEVRDADVSIFQPWPWVLGAAAEGVRVLEELLIVALRDSSSGVSTARLLARERRGDDRLRDLEHVVQLEHRRELGVERAARVLDLDALEPFAQAAKLVGQLLQALFRPEHARARLHVALHLLANRADLFVPPGLLEVGRLDAARLVPEHRVDGVGCHRLRGACVLRRRAARRRAEDEALRERVGAKAVAAVEPDVGALAGGVETEHRCGAGDVRVDPTHHVVHHGAHRDGLVHDVDADELAAQLAHEGQLAIDDLLAEMADIEVHVLAVRALEAASCFELGDHGAGDDVAWAELHLVRHVVLEEPVAVLVRQVTALAAHGLGDEDASERKAGRMELDHLHVLQADAGAVRERHSIARADVAVGRERVEAAQAAGGEDHGLGGDCVEPPRALVERDHADAPRVLDEQLGDEGLVVAVDLLVLERGLEDRVEHVEPALVGGEARAPGGHASEGADGDRAVRLAAPWAPPVLHLDHLDRRLSYKGLDNVLVGEVVRALDGVESMGLVRVFGPHHGRGSALGGDGVAAHRVDLGDHPHLDPRVRLHGGYRRPDAGEPSADHQDVVALHLPVDSIWTRDLTAVKGIFWAPPSETYPGSLPDKTDVLVIGGGIAGTSLMHHLAKRRISAVLVESRHLAFGTR